MTIDLLINISIALEYRPPIGTYNLLVSASWNVGDLCKYILNTYIHFAHADFETHKSRYNKMKAIISQNTETLNISVVKL